MAVNWSQIDRALQVIPDRADAAVQTTAGMQKMISAIKENPDWSVDFKDREIQKVKDSTVTSLQQIRAAVGAAVNLIDLNQPPALGSDEPLAELKLARTWARIEKMLDGGVAFQTIVNTAISDQDTLTIRALREEMPARIMAESSGMAPMDATYSVELSRKYLATAVATGFAGTDEGRWLGAKLQADLLSQIAHIQISIGFGDVVGQSRTFEDAVTLKLLKQDLDSLRAKLPAESVV